MNKEWLKYNRTVIYLLISAAIVMAVLGGMDELLNGKNQSFAAFMGYFIGAAIFQSIFVVAVFVSLASYHPRIAGVGGLLVFFAYMLQYPSSAPVAEELIADYPVAGVAYLFGMGLNIIAAALVLVNSFKRQRSAPSNTSS